MNYIDMFILVLLIWAVYRGYTHGFITQLTILVALAAGIFAAVKLSGVTANFLEEHVSVHPESLYLISLGITFVLVFIGVNILGNIVESMVEATPLSMINRILGIFLSVVKVIIITGVILAYINRFDRHVRILPENSREHSLFYKPFTNVATAVFPSLKVTDKNTPEHKDQV